MTKKKSDPNSKGYKVYYTKKVGGVGTVLVKARNPTHALKVAKSSVFTGSKFRNPTRTKTMPKKNPMAQR